MGNDLDRILRLKAVLDQTGLSRSTLYRKLALGQFPRPVRLSERCVGWRASAVTKWMHSPMFYHLEIYAAAPDAMPTTR